MSSLTAQPDRSPAAGEKDSAEPGQARTWLWRLAPWLLIGGLVLFHAVNNWLWLGENLTLTGWDRPRHLAHSLTYARMLSQHGQLKAYPDTGGMKLAAAQLIERCIQASDERPSWARADAPVRVWPRQPLVLTNPGRRPASEVLRVADQIRDAVQSRFNVRLHREPDLIEG